MKQKLSSIVFYVTLFLFIFLVSFQTNMVDYDLFARLLQGKAFWSLGNILYHDIFSYTPTHTWYDHEWGSSVVFYWVFEKFGTFGLLCLKSLMIFGIFAFVIEALKVKGTKFSTPYNFLFYFLAYHAAAQAGFSNTIRCQLFTYLFFAIWFYLLERVRTNKEYYLLVPFVPMMLFWSNIHGGCFAGFGLLILYAIGEAINRKPFKYYLFTLFACFLIMFVNPWGIDYVKFLFMATTMPRILIQEWQPTFGSLNADNYMFFKCFFIPTILLFIINLFNKIKDFRNFDYTKIIVCLTMAYLSLKYTRHQPFYVLSVIVFLYDDIYQIFSKISAKLTSLIKNGENLNKIKEFFLFGLVAFATIGFFAFQKPQIVINNNSYPIKSIEFIKINDIKGNLLVNFHHGSYAAYKLFPNNLIAMDGRYEEVYPDYLLPMFNNFYMQVGEKPNMLIETFRPDIIVMSHIFPADKALDGNKTYKKVYDDENYSVFVDSKKAKNNYIQPTADKKYYNDTLFDSRLKFSKRKMEK